MREHRKIPLSKARLRSAISRGKFLLADIDHRCAPMLRLRDLLDAQLSDIGGEQASHAKRVLANSASMLTLLREMKQQSLARKLAEGKDIPADELDSFQRVVNTERRQYEALGLERQLRDVTPTIDEYLASRTAHEDADVEVIDG